MDYSKTKGYSKSACPHISRERELVLDYCAGALDAGRAAEFERHMEHCDACAGVVAAQREVWETLDGWRHVDLPEVSPNFDAQLYVRIAHEQAGPAWKNWLRRIMPATPVAIWKPAISLAVACAVLAIGLRTIDFMDLTMARAPKPVQNTAQMEADRVDIEQVANTLDELDLLMPVAQRAPASQTSPRVM